MAIFFMNVLNMTVLNKYDGKKILLDHYYIPSFIVKTLLYYFYLGFNSLLDN